VRACRIAVEAGAPYSVSNTASSAAPLFHTFRRRLRLTHKTGQHTVGLSEAVNRLELCGDDPVLAAQVDSGPWKFLVWMTPDGQLLIACTGVERPAAV
jgi:hypothetical protein